MNYFAVNYALGVLENKYTLEKDQTNTVPPLYYDDVSALVTGYQEQTSTDLLDALKKQKLSLLDAESNKFSAQNKNKDMYLTSSLGFKINADKEAKGNLKDLVDIGSEPVVFRVYDNTYETLTLEQVRTLWKEVIENGELLYKQKWQYEQEINACTTIEQLNAIDISFTMADFS